MDKDFKYYDLKDDLAKYPDAWCYLIWSARSDGKTYSTLRYCVENKKKFAFIKRTIDDVNMLCTHAKSDDTKLNVSPFKPLNRDFGWNYMPIKVNKGFAGFYNCDENDKPYGDPVGYAVALAIATDVKGFDISEVDYIIFDEFIPARYARVKRTEGAALLDIYMTAKRDRKQRGREELKLVCIANATSINNPTFQVLEVTDIAARMDMTNTEYYYDQRKIMMHFIPGVELEQKNPEDLDGIEIAMMGTEWAAMSFGGHFAYDDFTAVKHIRLKGYQPLTAVRYNRKEYYIYIKDGYYYMCKSKAKVEIYDLSRENEQKRFFYDYVFRLRDATISNRMAFSDYSMYDLIINYKNIFKI
ncbi:MAG: phage DNA encapsidation protein [Methanobrevibacter sp.]|nr:phage DNA encapsidation protein [Methanobrevibacter sp.]MBO7717149.1 phage DNA encapsidation protein [Methanobrevibacter sp.]